MSGESIQVEYLDCQGNTQFLEMWWGAGNSQLICASEIVSVNGLGGCSPTGNQCSN